MGTALYHEPAEIGFRGERDWNRDREEVEWYRRIAHVKLERRIHEDLVHHIVVGCSKSHEADVRAAFALFGWKLPRQDSQ
jgi:hypothetical protein